MSESYHDPELQELERLMKIEFSLNEKSEPSRGTRDAPVPSGCHTYEPLSEHGVIRLFRLQNGNRGDVIRGSIEHVHYKEAQHYEAVSYAWGSEDKPHHVLLSTGILPITTSLYTALLRFRRQDVPITLWIDAICIDQSNNAEKSEQVLLMPRIYSEAACVLVWLGEDKGDGANALQLLDKISQTNFNTLPEKRVSEGWIQEKGLPDQGNALWSDLLNFFRRPWFRRTWVYQEFINAKNVVVFCGEEEVHWKSLTGGTEKTVEYQLVEWGLAFADQPQEERIESNAGMVSFRTILDLKYGSSLGSSIANIVRSFSERDESSLQELKEGAWSRSGIPIQTLVTSLRQTPESIPLMTEVLETAVDASLPPEPRRRLPLLYLLTLVQYSKVTDPKDKLFALLGLSKESNDIKFRPNYDETVEAALLRYGRAFVSKGQGIDVLYQAGTVGKRLAIPSWIPDWTQHELITTRIVATGAFIHLAYSAASDMSSRARVTEIENELFVSGSFIDTISSTLPSPKLEDDTVSSGAELISDLRNYFDELDKFMLTRDTYVDGQCMVDVQWRTLIGNLQVRPHVPPDSWREQYEGFRFLCSAVDAQKAGTLFFIMMEEVEYFRKFISFGVRNSLCKTLSGLVGLVPNETQIGDRIFLPAGSKIPYVLRPLEDDQTVFQMISGCYVHGMMRGEELRSKYWKEEEIRLR